MNWCTLARALVPRQLQVGPFLGQALACNGKAYASSKNRHCLGLQFRGMVILVRNHGICWLF
jgi:hypothetical protein